MEAIFLAGLGGETAGILRCVEALGSPLLEPARHAYVSSVYVRPDPAGAGCSARSSRRPIAGRASGAGPDAAARLHSDNAGGLAAWRAMGFGIAEHLMVRPLDPERP